MVRIQVSLILTRRVERTIGTPLSGFRSIRTFEFLSSLLFFFFFFYPVKKNKRTQRNWYPMTSEYKYSFKRSIGRRNATIHSIWFPVNFHFANCFFWRIFYEWERIMISVPNRDLPVLLSTRQFQFFLRDSRGMKNCFLIEIIIQVCPPSFFFLFFLLYHPLLPFVISPILESRHCFWLHFIISRWFYVFGTKFMLT